jgi:hypothetical protein
MPSVLATDGSCELRCPSDLPREASDACDSASRADCEACLYEHPPITRMTSTNHTRRPVDDGGLVEKRVGGARQE